VEVHHFHFLVLIEFLSFEFIEFLDKRQWCTRVVQGNRSGVWYSLLPLFKKLIISVSILVYI